LWSKKVILFFYSCQNNLSRDDFRFGSGGMQRLKRFGNGAFALGADRLLDCVAKILIYLCIVDALIPRAAAAAQTGRRAADV
jgi:hypothetical protein